MELPGEDQEKLRELEEQLWREGTRFDRERMERLITEDYFEFDRSGRVDHKPDILAVPRQEIRAMLPLPDFAVRLIAPDVALVTYTSAVAARDCTEFTRRSSIWSRSSDSWVLRFHQGTPCSLP